MHEMPEWLSRTCGECRKWVRVAEVDWPVGVCEDVCETVGDDRSLYASDVCRYVRAADDMACEDYEEGR